jgi:hypothetical protein
MDAADRYSLQQVFRYFPSRSVKNRTFRETEGHFRGAGALAKKGIACAQDRAKLLNPFGIGDEFDGGDLVARRPALLKGRQVEGVVSGA